MANFVSATPIQKDTVNVFESKTGKFYGCFKSDNSFIGMISSDFDPKLPAFIIAVVDEESGEGWDFIGNHTMKEVAYTI